MCQVSLNQATGVHIPVSCRLSKVPRNDVKVAAAISEPFTEPFGRTEWTARYFAHVTDQTLTNGLFVEQLRHLLCAFPLAGISPSVFRRDGFTRPTGASTTPDSTLKNAFCLFYTPPMPPPKTLSRHSKSPVFGSSTGF